jgi:hypothetical protein
MLSLVMASAACGGGDDGLEGTWNRRISESGKACAEQLLFDHDDYVATIFCDLDDKTVGTQITAGRFRQTDNRVTVTPRRSTCPGWPKDPIVWSVSASRERLTRTYSGVITTFARGAFDITATKVMGCFDKDFGFTDGLLIDL